MCQFGSNRAPGVRELKLLSIKLAKSLRQMASSASRSDTGDDGATIGREFLLLIVHPLTIRAFVIVFDDLLVLLRGGAIGGLNICGGRPCPWAWWEDGKASWC